ncbi:MAG: type II toxin-antitoxin system RelE/ParE family toxin [Alphaproteobacteria bacterium]
MTTVIRTKVFAEWLRSLRDRTGAARIEIRIDRLARGNPGDVKSVGEGVSEMRIDFGPGYRVYFARRGEEWIVILAGGDKGSQDKDIKAALKLWSSWKDGKDGEG